MLSDAKFLFIVCQPGAEGALKLEIARNWPTLRFAYSRPGFVTFKLPVGLRLASDFELGSILARTYGFSLGKVSGTDGNELIRQAWQLAENIQTDWLHVWERDRAVPGENGFEPGLTPLAEEIGERLVQAAPNSADRSTTLSLNRTADPNGRVLDCVIVEPHEWWIGYHEATSTPLQWPGGVPRIDPPAQLISRAYFKITEALLWSRLPIKPGDQCVEIGSSPGGSSMALLERGYRVMGIDPAEMDPLVLAHPNFLHVRKRASDLKRREYRDVKWLFADANISPQETLEIVGEIVTHRDVHLRGMLLTLKLSEWRLAEDIPQFIEQVKAWGYSQVECRQLAFNRQEICLAARKGR